MIYHDMDFEQYKKLDALNASRLKDFKDSPRYCKYRMDKPMNSTPSMELGTLFHKWILEREDFESEYVVGTINNKRIKAYKEEKAEFLEQGLIVITPEDFENLKTLEVAIDGQNELTVKFKRWGTTCKSRFDSLIDDTIWDVKSSANARQFSRDIQNFKYYLQAGFYSYAFETEFGKKPDRFMFFVVPNTMPYNDYQTVELDADYLDYGRAQVDLLVPQYLECKEKNMWPIRGNEIAFRPSWLI